jgi:NTP pyrophosphatase (non-canonical NTP hydrolase)
MIRNNYSLAEFQKMNGRIYLLVNDRCYESTEMFSRLHHHITQVLKAVRKEKYDTIEYQLCMAFSWSLALANRFHINLEEEMWERFPGHCPYCLQAPCACKDRAKNRQKTIGKPLGKRPASLFGCQRMFAKIYPNAVINSAIHLAEEAGEVNEAIRNYMATHETEWFGKIALELVDAITHIFSVASCLKLNLAASMVGYFSKGCPGCNKLPCSCGHVVEDEPIRLFHQKAKVR